MASNVVIVESPAKAKTINKYLGDDYIVIASYGHIRDLPSKDGAIDTDNDFAMKWAMSPSGTKRMTEIKSALKFADTLILAPDPDREGEAIAWHIAEELDSKKLLKNKKVQRVTFNEITKNAIEIAFKVPRDIDTDLVGAYLARRALDRLVGFTLSPVLWRKLPGAKSAGRVQSVALRVICERESEIEKFVPEEFWNISVPFTKNSTNFDARLTHINGEKLNKFDINTQEKALSAKSLVEKGEFKVVNVDKKSVNRNPYAPFTTSTLQQEASKKLRFSPTRTMFIAQRLYEGVSVKGEQTGLITYMRTDGISLSMDAIGSIRNMIGSTYGEDLLPKSPRIFKSKAKNAQEAHEAIRPTNISRTPQSLKSVLSDEEYALYDLIWKRTMACQMANAILDQTAVDIENRDHSATLRTTGSVVKFKGFLSLYSEVNEDTNQSDDDSSRILPAMAVGDILSTHGEVDAKQSFTAPPPRFSEASIVKTMEEMGIGRPSTYTSILKVLQDREYVILENRRFIPHDRGRIVTAFLSLYFNDYFNYDFTANLEDKLDNIADGKKNYLAVLKEFWTPFSDITSTMMEVNPADIRKEIDGDLGPHFFPDEETRKCPSCSEGRLALNFGKFGAYIACGSYPDCKYSRPLEVVGGEVDLYPKNMGDIDGKELTLKRGPYGVYLELALTEEESEDKRRKPKRAPLPKGEDPKSLTYERAVKIVSLPREVGPYPDTGDMILAGLGRFGPFLRMGKDFYSVSAGDDVLEIGINRCVELVAEGLKKKESQKPTTIGQHPEDGEDVTIQSGRFGPYVKWGKLNAPLQKGTDMNEVTLEQAITALEDRAKKVGAKKASAKKATAKKASAKKATAKKASAKKATAKKTSAKKATAKKTSAKKATAKKA